MNIFLFKMNSISKKIIFLVLISYCIAISCSKISAQTKIEVNVESQSVMIGDHVHVFINAYPQDENTLVIWGQLHDTIDNSVEMIEAKPIDTITGNDNISFRQKLIVSAYDSGQYWIPALLFRIVEKEGDTQQVFTNAIPIEVQTIEVDTTQAFKDIKDIVIVKKHWTDYWLYYVIAVVLFALLFFVWYYFKKNKAVPTSDIQRVPPEKAHEKALRMLQELDEKSYWQQGQIKQYYSELSEIMRIYIEDRFDIPALEQTTVELLQTAKRVSVLKRNRQELKSVLRTADFVKFAKANPTVEEHKACMQAAITFVKQTILKIEIGEKKA